MIEKKLIQFVLYLLFPMIVNAQGVTYNLEVDLSDKIRPVTHCASGSLYGITESLPADIETMVAPLKPNVFANPAISGQGHQQPVGDALEVSRRLVNTTAKVQVRFADILPGWPYEWPGQTEFLNSCRDIINAKKESGRTNYDGYEIWNEPYGTWDDANGDFHYTCWKPTYELIKSLDPEERIIGPSFAYYSNSRMRDFLTYCKENNCLPDVICWHQWGSEGLANAVESYRELESSLDISPRAISINEYSSQTNDPYEGCPGYSIPFIAKFERHGVESACISWWHTAYPGRLGSLLTPSNEKGGGWHLYKWYGDMTGEMVSITPPDDYSDGIDGFGCIDEDQGYASICIGGNNTGTVNVEVNGIPEAFGDSVNLKVEYVPWEDKDTPVSGPVEVSQTVYSTSDNSITVPVNVTNSLYGYRVFLTPLEEKSPVTLPGKVEAENYISMNGIQTEEDEQGNLSIGFINSGDSASYLVDVSEAGNYVLNIRLASNVNGDNRVNIISESGESLGSLSIDTVRTAGWHDWYTDSVTINLDAGEQKLILEFIGESEYLYNIDWLEFAETSTSVSDFKESASDGSGIAVSSNPLYQGRFVVELLETSPRAEINVFNTQGRKVYATTIKGKHRVEIDSGLEPGMYFVNIMTDNSHIVERLTVVD